MWRHLNSSRRAQIQNRITVHSPALIFQQRKKLVDSVFLGGLKSKLCVIRNSSTLRHFCTIRVTSGSFPSVGAKFQDFFKVSIYEKSALYSLSNAQVPTFLQQFLHLTHFCIILPLKRTSTHIPSAVPSSDTLLHYTPSQRHKYPHSFSSSFIWHTVALYSLSNAQVPTFLQQFLHLTLCCYLTVGKLQKTSAFLFSTKI